MKKIPFLTNERLARFLVSALLCIGLLLPLMLTFGAQSAMPMAALIAAGLLALFTALGSLRRGRAVLLALWGVAAAAQLALPRFGFFGAALEAVKAMALYANHVAAATPLFAADLGVFLGVTLAVVCYAFSSRSVGFFPAIILVVLMLFGMWSLGRAEYLWYAAPALVALLLLIAQTSHERGNLFEALPMAVAVVLAALLLLPSGQTAVEPLHAAAMRLRQTISDYLFFTEPRNVFTLGAYGYYPMGSGRLGGEVTPSNTPVMTVKTDRRALLRAVVKDEYTGRSWRDTSPAKRYLYVSPRWAGLRSAVFQEEMPPASVRGASTMLNQYAVTVQMQDTATSTLFTPAYLRRFSAQSDMVAYFNDASELFITRDLQRGDRYTAFAPLLEGGDSALGSLIAATPRADASYASIAEKYTRLPEHLEEKVFEDVRNIVANAQTPYDKACAIQRHLQRYYRYTLETVTPPEDQDFVTWFLYVGREGYCTYYASAMTVLCRMAGLPARYVEGFVADPDATGFAYVTGEDAHAWTEVYFEGFGWVPFDATPRQNQRDDPPPPEPTPTPTPTPPPPEHPETQEDPNDPEDEPTPTPTPPPEDEPNPDDRPDFPWLWLLLLAALAALTARICLRVPKRVAARLSTPQERVFLYGNAAYALLTLTHRTPRGGETPMAFASRVDRQLPAPITPLWRLMTLGNYGGTELGEEEAAQASAAFQRLYQKQKPLVKARFLLWAGLGRGCYTCMDTPLKHEPPALPYNYAARKAAAQEAKRAPKRFRSAKARKRPKGED